MFYKNKNDIIQGNKISLRVEGCYPGDKDKGRVPGYKFQIILNRDNRIIGHLNFRTETNEDIELYSGQIGYGIDEKFRGNNYAHKACLLAQDLMSKHSPSVIITCNPDNYPSIRTIEKLGGKFIERVDVPANKQDRHQGFQKNRYIWNIEKF